MRTFHLGDAPRDHQRQRAPAGGEQRRQAATLRRAGRAPPRDEHPDREQRDDRDEARRHGRERLAELRVALDEEDVLRARPVAPEDDVGIGHEQGRHRRERDDRVRRGDQHPLPPRPQAPGREAQQRVRQQRAPERPEDDPGGEDHGVRCRGQRREQPRVPERDQQRPEAGVRPAPPRVQAGADEPPADERAEHRPHGAILEVVARDEQQAVGDPEHQRGGGEGDDPGTRRRAPHGRILTRQNSAA